MMTRRGRTLIAIAAVLLAGLYILPIWTVRLTAPQYPEGLGMQIRVSTITGLKPNDLANINNLNHYIGMKRITPEDIPELRLMPWAVAGLIAVGGLAAATGRRWLAITFVTAFALFAVAGLADFWWWEYDYGHNLDLENAIIKIPGMSYQPPLIGSKQIANFTATSLPASGALVAFAAFALAVFALVQERRAARREARAPRAADPADAADVADAANTSDAPDAVGAARMAAA